MKKKLIAASLIMILIVGLGAYGMVQRQQNLVMNAKPLLVMIDGKLYGIGGGVDRKPDAPPDGFIDEITERSEVPDADGEANFGTVGMPYWHVGTKIVVESSQYYVFNAINHQE